MEKMSPRGMAPALLTRMSAWPGVDHRAHRVAVGEVGGMDIDRHVVPGADLFRAASGCDSLEREAMCTAQPSLAKAMAQAKPMPRLPP